MIIVLLATVLLTQTEIHRCADGDGGSRFSDRPCGDGVPLQESVGVDDPLVRAWLESLPPPARPARPSRVAREPRQAGASTRRSGLEAGLPVRPRSDVALANCSLVFYECTRGDAGAMDRCIAGAPVCGAGEVNGCCASAYVDRYRLLRRDGVGRRSALRIALLGDR